MSLKSWNRMRPLCLEKRGGRFKEISRATESLTVYLVPGNTVTDTRQPRHTREFQARRGRNANRKV